MEILLEAINAWSRRRDPQFAGGVIEFIDFLLPAHITALAVAMLLYANDRLWPDRCPSDLESAALCLYLLEYC